MPVRNSARKFAGNLLASSLLPLLFALPAAHAAPPAVATQNNDNARTGANLQETTLAPVNVNTTSFGKLFTLSLDANVNGQVLYVPNLTVNGSVHNVLFAYTSNNANGSPCSVYAYDADNQAAYLWRHPFTAAAEYTTCAPVIDTATNTMYVLTKDNNDLGDTHLHALDITTGNERTGSPITVAASVPGTGDGSSGGVVSFDTTHADCRPGLLLLNGVVYFAFAHNTDSFPYHGWIFGYQYNGTAFTRTAVFCTNPNGGDDGIWMAGKGLTADTSGNLYCVTGNGTFDANSGGTSYGMCIVKLSTPNLNVLDWFAPYDELVQSNADLDQGSSGIVGIPGTNRIFQGGTKFGAVFLLNTSNLGHFTSGGPDKAQRIDDLMPDGDVGQNPICFDMGSFKYIYLWPGSVEMMQFQYDPSVGQLNPPEIYKQTSGMTAGGSLAISANGAQNGILWAVGGNHVLRAFDATDISKPELWDSQMNASRDGLNSVGHFQFPTVVNGKVYVPTGSASIAVYGLLLPATTVTVTNGSGAIGRTVTLSAVLRRASDNAVLPNRNVQFSVAGHFVGTAVTNSAGTASINYTIPAYPYPGSQTIAVTRLTNTDYSGSDGFGTLTVSPANTSVTVANVSGKAGQSVTLSAVLRRTTDNAVLSGSSLSFYVNNAYVATVSTDSTGTAQTSYTIPGNLSAGTQLTIKVVRLANAQYNASQGTGTLTVTP